MKLTKKQIDKVTNILRAFSNHYSLGNQVQNDFINETRFSMTFEIGTFSFWMSKGGKLVQVEFSSENTESLNDKTQMLLAVSKLYGGLK